MIIEHREALPVTVQITRQCIRCKSTKSIDHFKLQNKACRACSEVLHRWYATKKKSDPSFAAKQREKVRQWRLKNPEKRAAQKRRYWERLSPERKKELFKPLEEFAKANGYRSGPYTRKYSKEYARRHPERIKAQYRRCYAKHKAAFIVRAQRRRVRLVEATAADSAKLVKAIIAKWTTAKRFTCYYCQKRYSTKLLNIDHVVPISKGGLNVPENLAASCEHCNKSKQAKLPHEVGLLI